MIYDVHAHVIPAPLIDWMQRHGSEVGIEADQSDGKLSIVFDGRYRTAPLRSDLTETSLRLETMDRTGIDVQVLASWIDLTGYQLSPRLGMEWSKVLNESIAEEAASAPDRFLSIGSVPLQDPSAAAEELRRIVQDLGMQGVEIATRVDDTALFESDLDEFWAAAAELGAFVLMHPMDPIPSIDLSKFFMHNAVGRPIESSLAFAGLLLEGVFERHPDLVFCMVHGGGVTPYQIGRLNQGYRQKPGLVGKNLSMEPLDYLRRNVYLDTVLIEPAALRFLVDLVGAERILVGTDYPFEMGDLAPVDFVRNAGLTEPDVEAILSGNATRLFS